MISQLFLSRALHIYFSFCFFFASFAICLTAEGPHQRTVPAFLKHCILFKTLKVAKLEMEIDQQNSQPIAISYCLLAVS